MTQRLKKRLAAFLFLLIVLPAGQVFAADKNDTLNNYYYAHANKPGTFEFMTKGFSPVIYGDDVENDAVFKTVTITAQGMQAGDKITLEFEDGSTMQVTPGQTMDVSNKNSRTIMARLVKTGNNEVYTKMTACKTADPSYVGGDINYTWNMATPSHFGGTVPDPDWKPDPDVSIVKAIYYYASFKDEYRVDYDKLANVTKYELHYLNGSGQTLYRRDYNQAPTGIHWLTCNGTYEMRFYNSSGTIIGKTNQMTTSSITNPTCASYEEGQGTGNNNLNGKKTKKEDGTTELSWDADPNASKYEIWKDGQKIGETTDTKYNIGNDGSVTIISKDPSGNTTGQSDVPQTTPTNPTDPGGCGDQCEKLRDLLACPEWDIYMGDLTNAIKNALPPPPDWDMIADKIGNSVITKLADYFGEVPAAPTVPEIEQRTETPLPNVNNRAPDAENLVPTVPGEFNQEQKYDLSDAPVIEIKDESKPFIITDPMSNVEHDGPNVPVFPGDQRNNTGGIETPTTIDSNTPLPQKPPPDDLIPIPSVDVPTPTPGESVTPIPDPTTGIVPIPRIDP